MESGREPKIASLSGDSSRLAPRRSRVRTPDEANFPPVGLKKSLSLCLPQGMALMGMSQDSEIFSVIGEVIDSS